MSLQRTRSLRTRAARHHPVGLVAARETATHSIATGRAKSPRDEAQTPPWGAASRVSDGSDLNRLLVSYMPLAKGERKGVARHIGITGHCKVVF